MLKISFGRLKPTCDKVKANRASETEEQRKERLTIGRKKYENQKLQEEKKKVVRNRRPRETAPGHSQKIEAR